MSASLNSNFDTLFGKMENFISTKTVVGEPVFVNGVIIVPLVDVVFGVAAGVNEGSSKDEKKVDGGGGGGGLGGRITPTAVLVIIDGTVQLINIKSQDNVQKLIDMVPGIVSKLNIGSIFGKKKKDGAVENAEVEFKETTIVDSGDAL
ncbi:MAG: sporulation protein [Clostridiales bacterium]|nr:sporulation protein [Clostridiales bacterium]